MRAILLQLSSASFLLPHSLSPSADRHPPQPGVCVRGYGLLGGELRPSHVAPHTRGGTGGAVAPSGLLSCGHCCTQIVRQRRRGGSVPLA